MYKGNKGNKGGGKASGFNGNKGGGNSEASGVKGNSGNSKASGVKVNEGGGNSEASGSKGNKGNLTIELKMKPGGQRSRLKIKCAEVLIIKEHWLDLFLCRRKIWEKASRPRDTGKGRRCCLCLFAVSSLDSFSNSL